MEIWVWVADHWQVALSVLGAAGAFSLALRVYWRGGAQRFRQTARSEGHSKIDQSISVK